MHFVHHLYLYLKSLALWNKLRRMRRLRKSLLIKLRTPVRQPAALAPVRSYSWGWGVFSPVSKGAQGSPIKSHTVSGWCASGGQPWRNRRGSQVFVTKTHSRAGMYSNAVSYWWSASALSCGSHRVFAWVIIGMSIVGSFRPNSKLSFTHGKPNEMLDHRKWRTGPQDKITETINSYADI